MSYIYSNSVDLKFLTLKLPTIKYLMQDLPMKYKLIICLVKLNEPIMIFIDHL